MIDPRYISGACFIFMGLTFIVTAIRILNTHPVNRVFILGPFVTNEGQRFILRGCYAALMIGCVAVLDGIAKMLYASDAGARLADTIGVVVAGFAIIASGCVAVAAWRIWARR